MDKVVIRDVGFRGMALFLVLILLNTGCFGLKSVDSKLVKIEVEMYPWYAKTRKLTKEVFEKKIAKGETRSTLINDLRQVRKIGRHIKSLRTTNKEIQNIRMKLTFHYENGQVEELFIGRMGNIEYNGRTFTGAVRLTGLVVASDPPHIRCQYSEFYDWIDKTKSDK